MEELGFFPNIEIIGALVRNGCHTINFSYLENILKFMQEHEIKPNEHVLEKIEKFIMEVRENIFNKEHNKDIPKKYQREDLNEEYKKFCAFYEQWLKNTEFEREKHLWSQFRTNIVEKVEQEDVSAIS
ncbi:Pentatricopeptide repeat-containing protein 1, partial [Stegodyphus mimosarum]